MSRIGELTAGQIWDQAPFPWPMLAIGTCQEAHDTEIVEFIRGQDIVGL